jgi:ubiquinone/menaquinone biosynthesis C-methylase UbiE
MNPRRTSPLFALIYDLVMRPLEWIAIERWRRWLAGPAIPGGLVLDLGSGTGANLPFIHSRAVATDLSLAMLLRSVRRHSDRSMLVVADASRLPFREDRFDAVIAALVFCEIEMPSDAFAEMIRVARPGSRIALLEHVRPPGPLLGRIFDLLERIAPRGEHFNRRTGEVFEITGAVGVTRLPRLGGAVELMEGTAPATRSHADRMPPGAPPLRR